MILAPVSKSTKLYFLIKSQCAIAPAGKTGVVPASFTTSFSSGVFPFGTKACGKLGNCTTKFCTANSTSAISTFNGSNANFQAPTFCLIASACSFSPFAIWLPISLDAAFTLDCKSSKLACTRFLWSSIAITWSTRSRFEKCLTASRSFANWVCCLK